MPLSRRGLMAAVSMWEFLPTLPVITSITTSRWKVYLDSKLRLFAGVAENRPDEAEASGGRQPGRPVWGDVWLLHASCPVVGYGRKPGADVTAEDVSVFRDRDYRKSS